MEIKINFKALAQSKKFKSVIWLAGIIVVLLLAFKAGEFIGFRRAEFSYRWGENYYRNLTGPRPGPDRGLNDRDFMMGHGTFGSIVKAASSTLVIQGRDGAEKVILIMPQTVVRRFQDNISVGDLKVDDNVVIIGTPNNAGQIEARLIRVMPPLMPTATGTPNFLPL
jgi:hypothetical protein